MPQRLAEPHDAQDEASPHESPVAQHHRPALQDISKAVQVKPLVQVHLDLGQVCMLRTLQLTPSTIFHHIQDPCTVMYMQANFFCQTCKGCGMTYAPGEETDERLHTAYHQSLVQGIRFQVILNELTIKADTSSA